MTCEKQWMSDLAKFKFHNSPFCKRFRPLQKLTNIENLWSSMSIYDVTIYQNWASSAKSVPRKIDWDIIFSILHQFSEGSETYKMENY